MWQMLSVYFFVVVWLSEFESTFDFWFFIFASLTGILQPLHVVKFKVFSHKENIFKFPPPLPGKGELQAQRPPGLEAVVSLLHTLLQQDLQHVIKSKCSFKESSCEILCSSQCRVWKSRSCTMFYQESWCYKQGHKTFVRILNRRCSRPRLWKLTNLFCVLNSKCFSIYKDSSQIHFWQSKKTTNVGRNLIVFEDKRSSQLPPVNIQDIRILFQQDVLFPSSEVTATLVRT